MIGKTKYCTNAYVTYIYIACYIYIKLNIIFKSFRLQKVYNLYVPFTFMIYSGNDQKPEAIINLPQVNDYIIYNSFYLSQKYMYFL